MDNNTLRRKLNRVPLSDLRAFDSIGSTNDEALEWVDQGAPDFSLVIADEQTKGRGRFDRKWVTKPGSSLAFSLILIPTEAEKEKISLFAPLCGIAVWQALWDQFNLTAEIKWPNDILLNRQKCAGILVEAAWKGNDIRGVVLGIGINISPASIPPMEHQMFPPICIETALGEPVDRLDLLAAVLNAIHEWRPLLGSQAFFNYWQEHLAFKGESVRIEQSPKPSIIGVVKGIDNTGRLLLTLPDGKEKAISIGDVHLRLDEQPEAELEEEKNAG